MPQIKIYRRLRPDKPEDEESGNYVAGDYVSSHKDLAAEFPGMFVLHDPSKALLTTAGSTRPPAVTQPPKTEPKK